MPVETLLLRGPATVLWDGSPIDPETIGPNAGVDELRFDEEIPQFLSTVHVRVVLDGEEGDPQTL